MTSAADPFPPRENPNFLPFDNQPNEDTSYAEATAHTAVEEAAA